MTFEFNSNFEKDKLKSKILVKDKSWKNISKPKKVLDGKWLMGGRVTKEGEKRRDLNKPRKTMKFLLDGYLTFINIKCKINIFFIISLLVKL